MVHLPRRMANRRTRGVALRGPQLGWLALQRVPSPSPVAKERYTQLSDRAYGCVSFHAVLCWFHVLSFLFGTCLCCLSCSVLASAQSQRSEVHKDEPMSCRPVPLLVQRQNAES